MSNRLRPRLAPCPECSTWRPVEAFDLGVDVCRLCLEGAPGWLDDLEVRS